MEIRHFYDLEIWKDSNILCRDVYKLVARFPKNETYGLVDQLKRSSSSVGANIAEGFGRYYFKEKIKFYYNARGSVCEVQNFLLLSEQLQFVEQEEIKEMFR